MTLSERRQRVPDIQVPRDADSEDIVRVFPAHRGHVVVVTLGTRTDAEQLAASEVVCDALLRQDRAFSVLMDLRRLYDYPPTQRQMYATVRERLRKVYAKHHRLTVYLVKNDRQRGFVTAVGWQARAASSSGRVFTEDWEDAFRRCAEPLAG